MHSGVAFGQVAGRLVSLEVRVVRVVRLEELVERVHVLLVAKLNLLLVLVERAVHLANLVADQVVLHPRLRPVAQTCARPRAATVRTPRATILVLLVYLKQTGSTHVLRGGAAKTVQKYSVRACV